MRSMVPVNCIDCSAAQHLPFYGVKNTISTANDLAFGSQPRDRVGNGGSNLGPTTAKLGPNPCTMTQNKARRTNKIDFLQRPWAQEVRGPTPRAPTTPSMSSADIA